MAVEVSEQLEAAVQNIDKAFDRADAQGDPKQIIALLLIAANHLVAAVERLERKVDLDG